MLALIKLDEKKYKITVNESIFLKKMIRIPEKKIQKETKDISQFTIH